MKAERHHHSSGDHLVAGFKGLGMGLVGGLTSMVTQPIEGASEKGVPVSTSCNACAKDCVSECKSKKNTSQRTLFGISKSEFLLKV